LIDTIVSLRSGEAALRATGAVCAAVDAVMAGEAQNAFCAIRPPGHHAEPARAMEFCLFNNVAIGALHAQKKHGVSRVAVVDFDVHYGNGTELILADDRKLFFGSTHQALIFPHTGSSTQGAPTNVVNCTIPRGAGSAMFRAAIGDKIIPALRRFRPELLLLSAGFDAHIADPIGDLRCTNEDYTWATAKLLGVAREFAQGRVVSGS
jgi:acetoin utilization deacetylase AcuC-like enzyme